MYEKVTKMEKAKSSKGSAETLEGISKYRIMGVPGQFSKESAEFFGVRTATSTSDGKTPIASYFPYYNQSNKLVGYKKRDWTIDKAANFHFTVVGDVKATHKMFGQQKYPDGAKKVILVEGEGDVMATWHMLEEHIKNTGNRSSFAVVGLPAGCVNAKPAATANEKFLLSGQELILGLDNDERLPGEKPNVKRGKEATEDVFGMLLSNKIKKVSWPPECKDARDYAKICLKDKKVKDFYDFIMFGSTAYIGSDIIKPISVGFDQFIAPIPIGIIIPSFPELMRMLRGVRKREHIVITGLSGVGKSTITSEFAFEMAQQGWKVGLIFLEEAAKKTLQRIGARLLEINYNKLKFEPTKHTTLDDLQYAWDWITDEEADRFVIVDHFGSMAVDDLMLKIKQLTVVEKCDVIILDHLSMLVADSKVKDERKEIDNLMQQLAAFVSSNDVALVSVSHVNREASKVPPPRGKENEPYWVKLKATDLRGSAGLEQMAWVIIAIECEIMPDRSRGRVRFVILKSREAGIMGEADTVIMDKDTGLFIQAGDEPL